MIKKKGDKSSSQSLGGQATTLKELNDHEEMDFSRFIGNLKTHKMEMKVREGREPTKKKSIDFKAIPFIEDQDDSSE